MNDILTTILKDTYTLSQLKDRLLSLKQFLLQKFFNGQAPEADSSWLKSLPLDFITQFTDGLINNGLINKDNVYKIFEDLEKETLKLTPLTLYLTFEPDDATLSQICKRAREIFTGTSVSKLLIFDIKYDPRLIAGTALSFKGVYRDYSLRSKIEERKMLILESFKKFLR